MSASLDPVTFEVVHHKLLSITEEQRLTFQSISGSPVVTEASDYFTGIFTADGRIATMGYKVATQGGPMTLSIHALQEMFRPTELAPGDVFLANDPYRCAVHQNDIQVLAPVFASGTLAAWAGFGAHEVDVGGMDFASWCPRARDVYQEGVRIPGIKLVDAGRPREDVWQFVLGLSRLPHLLDLDLRGMVAASHVTQLRLQDLADRYGLGAVQEAMERMIGLSAARLRRRLRDLPDGRFRAVDHLEHDGHENRLYRVALTLTKRGEELELDFRGSDDQAPGFVNCTRAGLRGGVVGALFPALAFDIPWNEGLLDPVSIVSRPGSICDALFPAPVGAATVEAVWVVKNVTVAALSLLKACSDSLGPEVQAGSSGTMATVNLGGVDQYGQRYGIHLMDPMLGGFGAYADLDGYDVGGSYSTPVPNVANVESNEALSPVLYLHRRLAADTGGAGCRRGGVAGSIALTAHGVASTQALIMTHGEQVPNSAGLFGGAPGSCVRQRLLRGSDLSSRRATGRSPAGVDELDGRFEALGPKPGLLTIEPGDVFETSWQGGGGVGDPLDRDPAAVADDLARGLCTRVWALALYGVVVAPDGSVDPEATSFERQGRRQRRLQAAEPPRAEATGHAEALERCLGGRLWFGRARDAVWFTCGCGRLLAPRGGDWRAGCRRDRPAPADAGSFCVLHEGLELRRFLCPGCGAALALDVVGRGAADLRDIELWG